MKREKERKGGLRSYRGAQKRACANEDFCEDGVGVGGRGTHTAKTHKQIGTTSTTIPPLPSTSFVRSFERRGEGEGGSERGGEWDALLPSWLYCLDGMRKRKGKTGFAAS